MIYKIRPGYSFLDSDGSTKTGGELIELSDDFANQHCEKVQAVDTAVALEADGANDTAAGA
jgi:hypothetical protein